MELPFLAHYKDAKQGRNLLLTPDGHEFRRQRAPHRNKCHYMCRMGTKFGCKVTAAVQIDTNMVTRMSGEHTHDTDLAVKKVREKEKDAMEEAAWNPTVSPRTVLGNLSVNVTAQNANAVSYVRNQAAFKKAVQRERAKLVANAEIPRIWD